MKRGDLTADDQTAMLADRYTQRAEVYDAFFMATAVKADPPAGNH